jgi:hypothetical protein
MGVVGGSAPAFVTLSSPCSYDEGSPMFSSHSRIALALSAALLLSVFVKSAAACDAGFMPCGVALAYYPAPAAAPIELQQPKLSWVFKRSTFTNDPITGARVGQYARKVPVEPLDDQRLVTSSYRRMRSELRGRDGSMDTTYVVQGWGDGGGELNAQWQMFNDVWKEAILSGSFFNGEQAFGPWGNDRWGGGNPNWNNGWNGGWNNGPGNGGWNGGGWNNGAGNGPWQGGWNRGRRDRDHWPSDNRAPLGGPNEPPASL